MAPLPDALDTRIRAALADANPNELQRIDQLAAIMRDWYEDRGLDLRTQHGSQAALTSITVIFSLMRAAHDAGELDDDAWRVVHDVLTSTAAAATITRAHAVL